MFIYRLLFSSGKSYVGQTIKPMNARISAHRAQVNLGSQLPVHCAWRKYGEPEVSVLGEFDSQDDLHAAEKAFIKALSTISPSGYNICSGGETAPSKMPEVAAKISAKAKGRKYSNTSSWVKATTEKWQDDEYREKVVNGLKAAWTDDRRSERSEMVKSIWKKRKAEGYEMSEETKQKLASYERTDETRAKMSASAKARKRDPMKCDTKQKIGNKTASSWSDPVIRAKRLAGMQAARERRKQGKV